MPTTSQQTQEVSFHAKVRMALAKRGMMKVKQLAKAINRRPTTVSTALTTDRFPHVREEIAEYLDL